MDLKKNSKINKEYGVYYYKVIKPDCYNDYDAPIYELYDENKELINYFAYYGDMKYYLATGVVI